MYEAVLVPLDGSEHAGAALQVAQRLLAGESGRLFLLHVSEIRPGREISGVVAAGASAATPGVGLTREDVERMQRSLSEQIERAEQSGLRLIEQVKRNAGLADLTAEAIVRVGEPAEIIVDEAEALGVDAIVMGSRGMSDIASLLMGGVSHKVMHTANCRVILVH